MTHPNGAPRSNIGSSPDLDRVVSALRENETFDRAQVAWLMSLAGRWGYDVGYEDGQRDELALASIAAAYTYTGTFSGENTARELKKVTRRREADAAARLSRSGDRPGTSRAVLPDDAQAAA